MAEQDTPPAAVHQPQAPLRLDGDDLYQWATLIAGVKHAQAELDRFGRLALTRRGLRPDAVTITNEGYVIPRRSGFETSGNGTD